MKTAVLLLMSCSALIAGAQQASSNKAEMAIPGSKGILEFDVGPTTFESRVRPDGKEVQLRALGRSDGLEITAFLQRVAFSASAEKCRDEWWPGSKNSLRIQRDNLQETVIKDGIARVEFIVPEFQGVKVQQKNLHAYVGGGDLCAEIHLSKAGFVPADQELFEDLLASVRLLSGSSVAATQSPAPPQEKSSSYYFGQGSQLYLQQNYSQAAVSYQKALDLEKQKRTRRITSGF